MAASAQSSSARPAPVPAPVEGRGGTMVSICRQNERVAIQEFQKTFLMVTLESDLRDTSERLAAGVDTTDRRGSSGSEACDGANYNSILPMINEDLQSMSLCALGLKPVRGVACTREARNKVRPSSLFVSQHVVAKRTVATD